jgi:hypothetical protein
VYWSRELPKYFEPIALLRIESNLQHERIIDRDLWQLHDAGRRDQADHERAVERGQQGDGDDPAGRHRMNQIADDAIAVVIAKSALP